MNHITQIQQDTQVSLPNDQHPTNLYTTLQKYFGYDTFRDHQEDIITSILSGHDTIVIMPTGAGKSLCYQLPAILSDFTTIVISPLISLMKDQVDYLESIGIKATYLNSSLTSAQFRSRLHGIYENEYKIIYVAPERLETEGFMNAVNSLKSPCKQVIIDEAHCVSRWGHDFRPSYTRILEFINALENRPTIGAFTATATETVRRDIEQSLGLKYPNRFITGFDRPNLEFKIYVQVDKDQYMKEYIREHKDEIGIIYAATRKETEKIYYSLSKEGIRCSIYHAGLSDKERNQAQEDFIYDNVSVIIATNAFGMGIDKSNVRYVLHYNMPRDLESYYQEAGRAGRDGLPSECILLYSAGDTAVQKYFIDEGVISSERKNHEYKNLQIMESYCHTTTCLRKYMLEYFGDDTVSDNCGNCSVCNNEYEEKDVTLEVQMILSCINRSGQRYGRSILVDALRGSKNKKVLGFHLDKLKTYGLMAHYSKEQIDLFVNKMIAEGYLYKTEDQYPILKLTEKSIPLLKNQGTVTMQVPKKVEKRNVENTLLIQLKELRKELAKKEGYPPYVIFHDATLVEMSSYMPQSLEELGTIKGVGESKKEKYGEQFLSVIDKYQKEHEKKVLETKVEPKTKYKEELKVEPSKSMNSAVKEPTYRKYLALYLERKSVEEVAIYLEVTAATVENNLLKAYEAGEEIAIDDFIQKEHELEIARLILDNDWDGTLKWIKERLSEEVEYIAIKAVILKLKRKIGDGVKRV